MKIPWSPQQPKPVLARWPAGPLQLSRPKTTERPKKAQKTRKDTTRPISHSTVHQCFHGRLFSQPPPLIQYHHDRPSGQTFSWSFFRSPHRHEAGGVLSFRVCVCVLNISIFKIETFLSSRVDFSVSLALIFTERQAYHSWFCRALSVWPWCKRDWAEIRNRKWLVVLYVNVVMMWVFFFPKPLMKYSAFVCFSFCFFHKTLNNVRRLMRNSKQMLSQFVECHGTQNNNPKHLALNIII